MSSYSVSSVLNMVFHGAEGSTASQLKEGLQLKDFDVAMVKNGFKEALKLLKTGTNENFTLNAVNRYVKSNRRYWTNVDIKNSLVFQIIITKSGMLQGLKIWGGE